MFFQPIKNDDPQPDFYTMRKRETVEYDTEYMQEHNDDLNTTLIFVCCFCISSYCPYSVDHTSRLVCSPQSVPPSSSTSSRNSGRIPVNDQKRTSERFSSASTNPSSQANSPQLLHSGAVPLRRLSQFRTSCRQVS